MTGEIGYLLIRPFIALKKYDLSSLTPIMEYIDKQFEEYMTAERHPGFRKAIPDTRIHAVLYFIPPNGHG